MAIILPKDDYWNNEIKNNIILPIVFVGGASEVYLLVKGVGKELESFILTGRADASELHVLPEKQEQEMSGRWRELGLAVTERSQKISYMYSDVTVIFPQISNPATGVKISLLPWFMLPSRPYPVFTYIYAIWHYHSTGKKSQKETAAATEKLFGIEKFNKSTVSRSIKSMKEIVDLAKIDMPLAVGEPDMPSDEELFKYIPEIMNDCTTVNEVKERYGEVVKRLPEPINGGNALQCVLSCIPDEFSIVIEESKPARRGRGDRRSRPARARGKEKRRDGKPIAFIGSAQISRTRIAFIETSRRMVLNAAAAYHRYLN